MRVLITTWVFPTHGGVFTFLDRMVLHLEELGHEFAVVAVEPSPGSRRSFPHDNVAVRNVPQAPLPSPLSFPLLGLILATIDMAKEKESDLIFCQDPLFSGIPSLIASRLLGIPLALADHGTITNFTTEEYWSNFGLPLRSLWCFGCRRVIGILLAASRRIYFPGLDLLRRTRELFGEEIASKTSVFPIGIDTDAYSPDSTVRHRIRSELDLKNRVVAIFVGRLEVESGLEYLIRAASSLGPEDGILFIVLGDGTLRRYYEDLAHSRAPGLFKFLGFSERVPDYLRAADILVFPKIFAGGYSVALREGMSSGLAPIATRGVDSHDDIIEDGVNGILVPARDEESLSASIRRLISSPDLRLTMGERARASMISRFGIGSFNSNIEDFFLS